NEYMKGYDNMYNLYNPYGYLCPYWANNPTYTPDYGKEPLILKDYGPEPFVVNIEEATLQNNNYRLALWTGSHLQLTLMSLNTGEDIGLEMHPDVDQFIRVEHGQGLVLMGD